MQKDLERVCGELEAGEAEYHSYVDGLSSEQLSWSPDEASWSILQCLEHLNKSAQLSMPAIDLAIETARDKGLQPQPVYRYGRFESWFLRWLEPPVKLRVKAPQKFIPPTTLPEDEVKKEFLRLKGVLRDRIARADDVDLARARFRSPAIPLVRFSLGVAFFLLQAHERRHLWQVRQIAARPEFPQG